MMNFYSNIPTELHLNGPNVKFSTNPINVSASLAGVATFTAISTATFPYNNTNGTFDFQWYFGGNAINDTSVDPNSNASIESSSAGITTFTLNGIDGDDDQKPVFVVATYIPGPDEDIISYPAEGINKATSTSAVLTAPPTIVITKQPTSVLIGSDNTAEFSIDAEISPSTNVPLSYKWELEGTELINGTTTKTVQSSGTEFPTMSITSDAGDNITLDWSQLSVYDEFVTGRTYTITTNGGNLTTTLIAKGAGGGRSSSRGVSGGAGGESTGTFTFSSGQAYQLRIGGAGANAGSGGFSGGGNGGGGNGQGGGGGGFTGLFSDSITIGNAVIIAGGGGGGANDPAAGGTGGGTTGGNGGNAPGRGGEGGTQSAGGRGGQDNGAALQGGPGAAGGGGGYYGGAGGNPYPVCCADGAGGGGSGYIGGVSNGTTTNGTGGVANGGNGSFSITRVSTTKTVTTTVSGAGTKNLQIYTNDVDYGGIINCIVTASNVINSPLNSHLVSYDVVPPRSIVKLEAYSPTNQYKTQSINLDETASFSVVDDTFGSDYSVIQMYAVEKDVVIKLGMYGRKGSNNGSNTGGQGGFSNISFTLKKEVEYTILGVGDNSSVFLYRGSNLIAVVGEGGDAGTSGNGGFGGGINVSGGNGSGSSSVGRGGQTTNLSLNGIFGSLFQDSTITLSSGDTIASAPSGGRTISCTKGSYWVDQGISACSNNSASKIRYVGIDGTTVSSSSLITRGFKPGYTISDTTGIGINNGGNGGSGATGGSGGSSGAGGGGGSGYGDGTISVITSTSGGGVDKARVNLSLG